MTKGLINVWFWFFFERNILLIFRPRIPVPLGQILYVNHVRKERLALPHYKPTIPLKAHLITLLFSFSSEAKQVMYIPTLLPPASATSPRPSRQRSYGRPMQAVFPVGEQPRLSEKLLCWYSLFEFPKQLRARKVTPLPGQLFTVELLPIRLRQLNRDFSHTSNQYNYAGNTFKYSQA